MKTIAILLLCVAITTTGFAPEREDVPMLDGRTKTSSEQLSKRLQAIVQAEKVTGLSVVVVKNRVIIYQKYFGVKNAATGEPFTDNIVSYAASLTKPLFTYLFLKLVDKGMYPYPDQ